MAYRLFQDGNCYICGKPIDERCDGCGKWVCNEHAKKAEVFPKGYGFRWCDHCKKKKKIGMLANR